jgi:hypothetical protein
VRALHSHERRDLRASTRLAKDSDAAWVTAELCDVVAHPLKGEHKVQHAGVSGVGEGRWRTWEVGEVHVTDRAQTVVVRTTMDPHHVPLRSIAQGRTPESQPCLSRVEEATAA